MSVQASRVTTTIDAPPSEVWAALTDKGKMKVFFFGSDIDTNWQVGSPIRFRGDCKGTKYEDKGVIKAFEPGKRLTFTHWSPLTKVPDTPEHYHTVTFELSPKGKQTEVALTQENENDSELRTQQAREELKKNWSMLLAGLKKVVEEQRVGVS